MIGIVDAKSGNIGSLKNALDYLKIESRIINDPREIDLCKKIILPGVGSFNNLKKNLIKFNLYEKLEKFIMEEKNYFLGICVGMQILLSKGTESHETDGLRIFDGKVINFNEKRKIKIPNIGWSEIYKKRESGILKNIKENNFYFLHSFFCELENKDFIVTSSNYKGIEFPSIIKKKNIYGVQFHPEKSRSQGLTMLKNFSEL